MRALGLKKLFQAKFVSLSDEELLSMMVNENEAKAFEELYSRFKKPMYNYIVSISNRSLAPDLLQDVFMKVLQNAKNFRGQSKVKTWMWSIARNHCIDFFKSNELKMIRNSFSTNEEGDDLLEATEDEKEDTALDKMLGQWTKEQFLLCLEELTLGQKECFILKMQSDLSYEEIAEMRNVKLSAIKSQLFRAKEKLMDCMVRGGHIL